jgi:hypothetical protein
VNITRAPLTSAEINRLRRLADVLIPGSRPSPPATALPDFDELLVQAASALGPELPALRRALELLPAMVDWDSLRSWNAKSPDEFELVSTLVAGAYFMSPDVLRSIGYATGQRSRAPTGQSANELGDGLLDDVMERGPVYKVVPAEDAV